MKHYEPREKPDMLLDDVEGRREECWGCSHPFAPGDYMMVVELRLVEKVTWRGEERWAAEKVEPAYNQIFGLFCMNCATQTLHVASPALLNSMGLDKAYEQSLEKHT